MKYLVKFNNRKFLNKYPKKWKALRIMVNEQRETFDFKHPRLTIKSNWI